MSYPPPSDADWSAWATLANDVTRALGNEGIRALFSKRSRIAEALWDLGYRPTPEQIAAVIERQREQVAAVGPSEVEGQ